MVDIPTTLAIRPRPWAAGQAAQLERLAALLKAAGDSRRLQLIALLRQQELCVCDLIDLLGWPQSLISHHLGVLRAAGLVRDRRDAQWVYYSLAPERLAELAELCGAVFGAELPPAARYGANQSPRCGS